MHSNPHDLATRLKGLLRGNAYPVLRWNEDGEETILSAAALWNLALERRHQWRRLGFRAGDFVRSEARGIEFVIDLVACGIGHHILWPRPMELLDQGSVHMIGDSGAKPSVFLPASQSRAWEARTGQPISSPNVKGELANPILLLQTSGTSGHGPKSVVLSAEAILYQIDSHLEVLRPASESTRLCILPWHHAFGLVLDLLLGLFAKQDLVIYGTLRKPPSFARVRETIQRDRPEWLALVPRQLDFLLSRPLSEYQALNIHVGGGLVGEKTLEHARGHFRNLIEGYGMTECGPGILLDGRVLPGTVIRTNADSELEVHSPSIGFWDERAHQLTSDHFLKTGDLCEIESVSGEIRILGRTGNRLKLRDGTWTARELVESEIERGFGIQHAIIVHKSEGAEVLLLTDGPLREPQEIKMRIVEFLEKRLGGMARVQTRVIDAALREIAEHRSGKTFKEALQGVL
ncbi:MAG: AMP-binding protein [Cryobacterium sp.]|nr:AMP-binding protein [Oligoflexia bacterium]